MAVNANEDQWVVKDIEEWSGVIFSQRLRNGLHEFWDKVYPGRASPDLQQMTSGSHMAAQCAGSSLRKAVDSSQSVGHHWLSQPTRSRIWTGCVSFSCTAAKQAAGVYAQLQKPAMNHPWFHVIYSVTAKAFVVGQSLGRAELEQHSRYGDEEGGSGMEMDSRVGRTRISRTRIFVSCD